MSRWKSLSPPPRMPRRASCSRAAFRGCSRRSVREAGKCARGARVSRGSPRAGCGAGESRVRLWRPLPAGGARAARAGVVSQFPAHDAGPFLGGESHAGKLARDGSKPVGFDALKRAARARAARRDFRLRASGELGMGEPHVRLPRPAHDDRGGELQEPRLTATFNALRERTGHTIIPQENSLLRMLKIVKRRGATGMLIDLNLRPTQAATIVEAFGPDGLKMCVPVLHAVLAQRANALFVPVETQPRADGTCRVIAHPGVEIPAGAACTRSRSAAGTRASRSCARGPRNGSGLTNISATARRTAARAYPAYANDSAKFEKLLRAVAIHEMTTRSLAVDKARGCDSSSRRMKHLLSAFLFAAGFALLTGCAQTPEHRRSLRRQSLQAAQSRRTCG